MKPGVHYPFIVSAPGKTIVFGEHAVVHGKAALAAAVSLRSYLLVDTKINDDDTVTLDFPDIKLHHTWSTRTLPWDDFKKPIIEDGVPERITKLNDDNIHLLEPFVQVVSPHLPEKPRKIHHSAAMSFLYLYMCHASQDLPACTYMLRSTVPIGSGLGSSASISVCISAAVLLQAGLVRTPSAFTQDDDGEAFLNTVNEWAFVGEMCIHGDPSGVDNTVATHGRAVLFKRPGPGQQPMVKPLHKFPQIPLLITDTRQPRSTAFEVKKVAVLRETQPAITDLLLNAIDKTTEAAHVLMTSEDFRPDDPGSISKLGHLITGNHGMLVALGVSHPRLERIRQLVDERGLGWTKLTGAGGGGCAITLLAKGTDGPGMEDLTDQLDEEGFLRYSTVLGARGVGVMEHVSKGINLKSFGSVKGSQEVEKLLGTSSATAGTKWAYWDDEPGRSLPIRQKNGVH